MAGVGVEVEHDHTVNGSVKAKVTTAGRTFETIDPRNEEVIARVSEGDKEDIDLAVKAAREAFDHGPWPRMPGAQRRHLMHKFADLIEANVDELAALDAMDGGKLFGGVKTGDVPAAEIALRYYAGAADKIHGETLKFAILFFFKVAPALAAGCTMVVKPAEQTPLSALYYAHLAKQECLLHQYACMDDLHYILKLAIRLWSPVEYTLHLSGIASQERETLACVSTGRYPNPRRSSTRIKGLYLWIQFMASNDMHKASELRQDSTCNFSS
ncbi:Aldehyde dehydrogenase family 2 member C4-like protein [Drosera capensis]